MAICFLENLKLVEDKKKTPDGKSENVSNVKKEIIKSKQNGHSAKIEEIKTTVTKINKSKFYTFTHFKLNMFGEIILYLKFFICIISTESMKEEDTSILDSSDFQTPENKKKENFLNYQRFLYRDGPTALGSKEIPEGSDCCLEGKTFVLTGVLESIERDDTKQLIEKYKGKVTSTLSKNTNYIIVGRDAGPAKLEKAEKFGTKQLNEDELFDLIRTASAGKSAKKKSINELRKISPNEKSKSSKTNDKASEMLENLDDSLKENIEVHEKTKPTKAAMKEVMKKDQEPKLLTSPPLVSKDSKPVTDSLMWVDKHKPQMLKQVIGQQGDRSNAKKLLQWLKDWQKNRSGPKKAPCKIINYAVL